VTKLYKLKYNKIRCLLKNYDLFKIYKLKFFSRLAVLYETGNMSAEYYGQPEVFLLKYPCEINGN